jgi:hypothetical protein
VGDFFVREISSPNGLTNSFLSYAGLNYVQTISHWAVIVAQQTDQSEPLASHDAGRGADERVRGKEWPRLAGEDDDDTRPPDHRPSAEVSPSLSPPSGRDARRGQGGTPRSPVGQRGLVGPQPDERAVHLLVPSSAPTGAPNVAAHLWRAVAYLVTTTSPRKRDGSHDEAPSLRFRCGSGRALGGRGMPWMGLEADAQGAAARREG